MLSVEQMRLWVQRHRRGNAWRTFAEFSPSALARALGMRPDDFREWADARGRTLPKRSRIALQRFIAEYESGKIAFSTKRVSPGKPRHIVRLDTPRPRRPTLRVEMTSSGPRLTMQPVAEAPSAMPSLDSLIGRGG